MTDDEILEVVKAHKEGKKIEGKWHDESNWWELTQSGAWARFHQCDYRVAPEPRKPREQILYVDEEGMGFTPFRNAKRVLFREVIE